MSVLSRLRSKSQLDVFKIGEDIRSEATRLVWNTNVVPKGWRDVFSKPMCLKCEELFHHMRAANSIRCTSDEKVEARKEMVQLALNDLKDMYDLITYMATTLPIDWNKFDKILTDMIEEEKKLKSWKDSVKRIEEKKK